MSRVTKRDPVKHPCLQLSVNPGLSRTIGEPYPVPPVPRLTRGLQPVRCYLARPRSTLFRSPACHGGYSLLGEPIPLRGEGFTCGEAGCFFQHFLGPCDRFTVTSTKESCGTVNLQLLQQHGKPALRHGMLPISLFIQHFLGPRVRFPVISTSVFDLAIAR